jgi:hypothetical protein
MQFGSPLFVQRTLLPASHKIKEIVRLLAKPYTPLYELQGQNDVGPLTVTYGGLGYAGPMLIDMLFKEAPSKSHVGKLSPVNPTSALEDISSDLIILEASKYLTRQLPSKGAMRLPFRVQFILDLDGELQDVIERFRSDARRNDMRKAEKFGYGYEISHSAADLEMFYHEMYLPTMLKRHGDLAALLSKREAQQLQRHGWLFLTKRNGTYVSGGLCLERQGVFEFREMGVRDGDKQLMREGAVGAMNLLRICWAHQEGFRAVNFGDCWPFISGIFRSKRKWGAVVSAIPHEHKQIWIQVQRDTPAVSHFFESNPCVTIDASRELHGLIVTHNPDGVTPQVQERWQKLFATPGLKSLHICSVSDLMAGTKSYSIPT